MCYIYSIISIPLDFAKWNAYMWCMKSLKDIVRKVIAHKHLGKEMIGAITINEVKKYFGIEGPTIYNENGDAEVILSGYVKFNKIFIKTQDQKIKIEIFKKKQDILTRVNEVLASVGYASKMMEIIVK